MKRIIQIGDCFLDVLDMRDYLEGTTISRYPSQRLNIEKMKDKEGSYLVIFFKKSGTISIKVKNNKKAEEFGTEIYDELNNLSKIDELDSKIKELQIEIQKLKRF